MKDLNTLYFEVYAQKRDVKCRKYVVANTHLVQFITRNAHPRPPRHSCGARDLTCGLTKFCIT